MLDQLLEGLSVRWDAIGQRIAADLHHATVYIVDFGGFLDAAGLQPLKIKALGFCKGVEHVSRQFGMLSQQLVPDRYRVVDRVMAIAFVRGEARFERVGNERLYVRM